MKKPPPIGTRRIAALEAVAKTAEEYKKAHDFFDKSSLNDFMLSQARLDAACAELETALQELSEC